MALVAFMALEWQIYLDIFKEQSLRLLTFQTFARGDEKTRPDKQKYNDKDNGNDNEYISMGE